ncbi:MAG: hypothetical protein ACXIVF_12740 [Rhizobiaceae bacterium]
MSNDRMIVGAIAGSALLLLAACGEDQPALVDSNPQTPESSEPANDGEPDVMDRVREGAGTLATEAERFAGEARERAERALEDAGPFLEQAGEVADRIGQSVDAIVRQAAEDLQYGVELLEERIAEMSGERVIVEDTEAALPPEEALRADTSAAARAVQAGVGPDYVGVWTDAPATCARIDQQPVENFAVITPTTIRRYESVCNFQAGEIPDGTAEIAAECMGEGEIENRSITLAMPDFDTLRISYDGHEGSAELIRCHLTQ